MEDVIYNFPLIAFVCFCVQQSRILEIFSAQELLNMWTIIFREGEGAKG